MRSCPSRDDRAHGMDGRTVVGARGTEDGEPDAEKIEQRDGRLRQIRTRPLELSSCQLPIQSPDGPMMSET